MFPSSLAWQTYLSLFLDTYYYEENTYIYIYLYVLDWYTKFIFRITRFTHFEYFKYIQIVYGDLLYSLRLDSSSNWLGELIWLLNLSIYTTDIDITYLRYWTLQLFGILWYMYVYRGDPNTLWKWNSYSSGLIVGTYVKGTLALLKLWYRYSMYVCLSVYIEVYSYII